MKIKLYLFGFSLFLALCLLALGNSQVYASDLPDDTTPTVTVTPSPSATWEEFIKTSTPRPKVNSNCPQGNPSGWGYVTPDTFWKMTCSQCITETPKANWPTFQLATMAPASTLNPTYWPTESALTQTAYRSPTVTGTASTPTPYLSSTPTGTWYGMSRVYSGVQLTRDAVNGQSNFKTWYSSDACGGPNRLEAASYIADNSIGFWTVSRYCGGAVYTNAQLDFGYTGSKRWLNQNANTQLNASFAPFYSKWGSIGHYDFVQLYDCDSFTFGLGPGHSWETMTISDAQFVCKNYNYTNPSATITPTIQPTQNTNYCASVKSSTLDQAILPSIKVGPLEDANCTKFPGVWLEKNSPWFTVPCGLLTCNIPDEGIGIPRIHVCYRPIKIDNYEILSQPIDINLLMFVAGAVMILRFLRRK